MTIFGSRSASLGCNLGGLHPGGPGGGWCTPAKKNNQSKFLVDWLAQRPRAEHRGFATYTPDLRANSFGKLQKQGIDPCASRMLSERSTTYHLGPVFVAKKIRATKGLELVQHPVRRHTSRPRTCDHHSQSTAAWPLQFRIFLCIVGNSKH